MSGGGGGGGGGGRALAVDKKTRLRSVTLSSPFCVCGGATRHRKQRDCSL